MKVKFVKQSSFQTVGPQGPFTRIFAVGETLDLPEMHARLMIANGNAEVVKAKAEFKADAVDGDGDGYVQDGTDQERPAKPRTSKPKSSK